MTQTPRQALLASTETGIPAWKPRVLGAMLIWAFSSLIVAWFEFSIFWDLPLLLFTMDLAAFDQTVLVWTLLARTLLVTAPAILIISASHYFGRATAARGLAWTAHLTVLSWLVIDCGLQRVTGATLWHYVEKISMTEDLSIGGDISTITDGIRYSLFMIGSRIVLLAVAVRGVMFVWRTSSFRSGLSPAFIIIAVFVAASIPGVIVAREFVENRESLNQVHQAMAFRTWLFHPQRICDTSTAAFGISCDDEFADLEDDARKLCKAHRADWPASHGLASVPDDAVAVLRPHIVVLLTESLRHDVLTPEHTPRLSRWAERSLVTEHHFSGSNCSELGAFAFLYSRYPMSYADTLDRQVPSEACHLLSRLGYERKAISSCSPYFCRMNEFIGPLNFDHEVNFAGDGTPWEEKDQRVLSTIAGEIKTASKPQFIFSHMMASHYSYYYPPEYDSSPPDCVPPLPAEPRPVDLLRDRYYKSLAFVDECYDRFLEELEGTNTIVVVTGDHGEAFMDNGFLCHGTRLSDIQTRTPVMIHGPNVPPGRISATTGHVDLMPTLLQLAGAGNSILTASHGQSLLDVAKGHIQLLTQVQAGQWECLLVHDDGRLGFTLPSNAEGLRITGFYNARGRIDPPLQRHPDEVPAWKARLREAFGNGTAID
ncbi:MAG: sulfatase-like hydrolase/transferase [Planctomycetaceae bacterium]